jgi:hypothetical protein
LLFSIRGSTESNDLEIITFSLKTEEFFSKKLTILKKLSSHEIRFVVNNRSLDSHKIYIIGFYNGNNYFFCLNYHDGSIVELPTGSEVGISPSFQKLNEKFLIAIGGIDSDTINIYDTVLNYWYYVGKMSSVRSGGYALLNEYENIVYIAGGVNSDYDNSLSIDYFVLSKEMKFEVKTKKLKDDFLLKKTNPVVIPVYDYNTYLICGGEGMFGEVNTCSIYYTDRDILLLSNANLPKAFSTTNQNVYIYKACVYFFINQHEVMKYNSIDNTYTLVKKDIIDITC